MVWSPIFPIKLLDASPSDQSHSSCSRTGSATRLDRSSRRGAILRLPLDGNIWHRPDSADVSQILGISRPGLRSLAAQATANRCWCERKAAGTVHGGNQVGLFGTKSRGCGLAAALILHYVGLRGLQIAHTSQPAVYPIICKPRFAPSSPVLLRLPARDGPLLDCAELPEHRVIVGADRAKYC
jgi:hypothetical protein